LLKSDNMAELITILLFSWSCHWFVHNCLCVSFWNENKFKLKSDNARKTSVKPHATTVTTHIKYSKLSTSSVRMPRKIQRLQHCDAHTIVLNDEKGASAQGFFFLVFSDMCLQLCSNAGVYRQHHLRRLPHHTLHSIALPKKTQCSQHTPK
jgi:hypothetical protein